MAFLDEEAVRLPRGPVEARRNSQEEEEGRFQRAFFDLVLGKRKPSSIVVSARLSKLGRWLKVLFVAGVKGIL
jgi:hypothetical protein